VDRDSILLGPEVGGAEELQQHLPPVPGAGIMAAQPLAPMMPVTYLPQAGMAHMPPFLGLDQSFSLPRPPMWQHGQMQQFVPPFAVPPPQPGVPGQGPLVQGGPSSPLGGGGPSGIGHRAGAPRAGAGEPGTLPQFPAVSGPPPGYPGTQPTGSASAQQGLGGQRGAPSGDSGAEGSRGDGAVNLPPELQQLVRQLALSRLGAHSAHAQPEHP
jgi:hypothetical protein